MGHWNRLSFVLFAMLLWSCGDNTSKPDLCGSVTCEGGVCDAETGDCVNPSVCGSGASCLDGYSCVEGLCAAEFPCDAETPCERGSCIAGACLNPPGCAADDVCLFGYRCQGGVCVDDACAGVDCARGVCNPDSGACVNRDVCIASSQAVDCLDGYYCYGQTCVFEDEICADLSCSRGACDAPSQQCVDAQVCQRDTDCLAGNYCNAGSCDVNQCDVQQKTCARGVCLAATAQCVNPETCATPEQCLDGFSCVEGACVRAGMECEPTGCPGNQVCTYDPANLTGRCEENAAGCSITLDCASGRVCRAGSCSAPNPCEPDAFEPNDDAADGVRIADLPGNLAIGSICPNDLDVFLYHTDDSPAFRGVLVVDLVYDPIDVGAGDIEVEVVGPDGNLAARGAADNGRLRIEYDIGVLELGGYEIRVMDPGGINDQGIGYSLFVSMMEQTTVDACAAASALGAQPIMGNTNSGQSFELSSGCANGFNDAGEEVYSFDLAVESWVAVTVAPDAGVDVTVSLRERCEVTDDIVCVDSFQGAGQEFVGRVLPPGSYYVMVEGASRDTGGAYTLTFSADATICEPADATCVDATTSRYCTTSRTDFEEIQCADGCDAALGLCSRAVDDVCHTATDASAGLVTVIAWDDLANDYDPGANSCVPEAPSRQTDGPDAAFVADLPDGSVLIVNLDLYAFDAGSLYLVEDCGDVRNTCLAASNLGTQTDEEIVYVNDTGADKRVWIIADVADETSYSTADIAISVEPLVCTPLATRCVGDDRETCNRFGSGWDSALCTFGCSQGQCNPLTNDACLGPVDLLANGPFTGRIDEYSGDFNPGGFSGCTGRFNSGPDATFEITPAAGDIVTLDVVATFDAALWVATDCADAANTCIAGTDTSGATDETIQFVADGTTTYLVYVDSITGAEGTFTISATTQQPSCTPGEALSCVGPDALEYCTDLGVPSTFQCAGGCSGSACGAPQGEICADAIPVVASFQETRAFDGADSVNPGAGVVGACDFGSSQPQGSDRIYAIDLVPGDFLFADFTSGSSFTLMYLLGDCTNTDSCIMRSNTGLSGSLVYEATTSETVYLVVDRTTSGTTTLDYDLSIEVRQQNCVPGSAPVCQDATTIGYCDALGFSRTFACMGSCSAGACASPQGDVCVDAITITSGAQVSGDWLSTSDAVTPSGPHDGDCWFDDTADPVGNDKIYRIDLVPGDLLRADLTTTNGAAYVYILDDCLDTSTCRDVNTARGAGTVYHYADQAGPVWIVIDSSSTFSSSTTWTLDVSVTAGGAVCTPGRTWCDGGGAANVCDDSGTSSATYICDQSCTNGGCEPATGADTCASAPLTAGTFVESSWAALSADINISSSGCTGRAGPGSDLVYAVQVAPGEVVHARVESHGGEASQLYVLSDCTDPDNACLSGAVSDSDYVAEVFYSPTTVETVYVVADATSSANDEPFSMLLEVVPQECTPGTYACSTNAQDMDVCNSFGLFETYSCAGGCTADACGTPRGESCADPIVMGDGDTFGEEYGSVNNLDPGVGVVGGCNFASNERPHGSDRIHAVDLLAGDVLVASYTSGSSFGLMYIITDCGDASTCVANTSDGTSGMLQYVSPIDQRVYVVMDRTITGSSTLTYDLDISVVAPDCTPGSSPVCNADGTTLEYCDEFGFTQQYACGGASATCTVGACDTPTGGICIDAPTVVDGAQLTGQFVGTDDLDPGEGVIGGCNFATGERPDGVDHFYRVDLAANEILEASYDAGSASTILYLVSDCADGNTCLANTNDGATGRLIYQASAPETVYLVVDRTTTGTSTLTYTVDITVTLPNCTIGQAPACAADGVTLESCAAPGLLVGYTCSGTCTANACDMPTGDACVDPILLTDGAKATGNFDGTNESDLGTGSVGSCNFGTSEAQPGTDHFYRVDLLANQTLTASFTSTSSFGILSLMRDCADASSCLQNTADGSSGTLNYTATTNETVFLVMDRTLAGATTSFTFEVDVTIN